MAANFGNVTRQSWPWLREQLDAYLQPSRRRRCRKVIVTGRDNLDAHRAYVTRQKLSMSARVVQCSSSAM